MSPRDGAGGGVGDSIKISQWPSLIAQVGKRKNMTISAMSHYRGGTIDEVAPLAKTLKAYYLKHGVAYRLSRFQTGPNAGDWFVVVQYADQTAYEKAQTVFAKDPECQQAFVEIAKFAKRISREMVIDLDL
jgi:hypothetical protein